jgi:hypothetical protein
LRWKQRLARIVVVTHEFDNFAYRKHFWHRYDSHYMLFDILECLRRHGHSWRMTAGPRRMRGDIAILHTDCTVVGKEYLALAADYRIAINFGAADISKRRVSGAALSVGDAWCGPVVIKSDFNHMGYPEALHNRIAEQKGRPLPYPGLVPVGDYSILPSRQDVPDALWTDNNRVIERFVPERDEHGYALRTWVFMGGRERCTRHVSPVPIVKSENIISRSPSDVPDALRAERARLGFDFGKFDFVVHEGEPILLDANRTPSSSPALRQFLQEGMQNLAEGLGALMSTGR